ncbi:MAG: sulfatase-like hydrolase/transferase [Isosphaeraceae bacterium]
MHRPRCWIVLLPSLLGMFVAFGSARADEPAPAKKGTDPKRPNIVFIFGDDSGIDCYSCYGSDRFKGKSPNIDALAASGVQYTRAYSTPLCGPSRCVLMTGRYGFRTGGLSNQSASNASFRDEPSVAKVLKEAGYATGMAGKWRQMSDSPGDWGFDEYITDPTAGGWYWEKWYTQNGKTVTRDKEVYYPDVTTDFAVDFMKRHRDRPFYFYLSQHLIHGRILRTPSSKPGASAHELYDDNLVHLDHVVGRVVAALEELGLREKTLIVFSADNGTAPVGYTAEHDPAKSTGKIGGRYVNGRKGQLLEGGSRVPLIVSWKGTTAPGQTRDDLVDFSDLLPTFADVAGASLPKGVTFDGRSFAPGFRGEKGNPREWVFVQLGRGWYVRDDAWKLNERGELFAMKDSPFAEEPVAEDSTDPQAKAARQRLSAALASLNPAGGKVEPLRPAAKKKQARQKAQAKKKKGARD